MDGTYRFALCEQMLISDGAMLPQVDEDSLGNQLTVMEAEKVVVAVKAEKVIVKSALAWALTHVVHPGDCIILLAVLSTTTKSGKKIWKFPWSIGDCSSSHRKRLPDQIYDISECCSQMVLQLHNEMKVQVRIKVVSGTPGNAVATEARRCDANWVVLDKKLKQEVTHCVEDLCCNIVVMKGSQAKVLKLDLGYSNDIRTPYFSACSSPSIDIEKLPGLWMKHSTPVSSPEQPCGLLSKTTQGSLSSDSLSPPFHFYKQCSLLKAPNRVNHTSESNQNFNGLLAAVDSVGERILTLSMSQMSTSGYKNVCVVPHDRKVNEKLLVPSNYRNTQKNRSHSSKTLLENFLQYDKDVRAGKPMISYSHQRDPSANSSIRDTVPLGRISSSPPPLCSLCQHKAPAFGKPPRQFSYNELEEATARFSKFNCLAEGGFGKVYRGTLSDGRVVAVKLLKARGSQADAEFCREVRVLSCAQHRNVVLLIGFSIDGKKRILVYEYICNRSLDYQLHGNKRSALDFQSRLKIAVGTARGLRYLHEDCRVGCILHGDMRSNNILLTHDFEPLVADFGLARWYSDRNCDSTEELIISSSGYLAPEFVDGGNITEKVDVYAFGLVLLELMTGRRVSELQLYKGQQFISEWWLPETIFEPSQIIENILQLLDPSLPHEEQQLVENMACAASLCVVRDPQSRPPMSKVLRVLEGGEMVPKGLDMSSIGSKSSHLCGTRPYTQPELRTSHSRRLSH